MQNKPQSPMGENFELQATLGGRCQKAVVTEIAGSLRALEVDGVALLQDYPAQSGAPSCAGWVLVPWPNRVADGQWTYDGVPQQLEITEPGHGNALHGLLTRAAYSVAHRTEDSITLAADVTAEPGYPFELATAVRYQLVRDGLLVTHSLTNTGSRAAPAAAGAHPYLRLGSVPTEDLTLVINADTHIEVNERLNPTGAATAVRGTRHDFRAGQRVGAVSLDDAWGDVCREPDGSSLHYLEAPGRQPGAAVHGRVLRLCPGLHHPDLPHGGWPGDGGGTGTDDGTRRRLQQRRGAALAGSRRDMGPQLGHPPPPPQLSPQLGVLPAVLRAQNGPCCQSDGSRRQRPFRRRS